MKSDKTFRVLLVAFLLAIILSLALSFWNDAFGQGPPDYYGFKIKFNDSNWITRRAIFEDTDDITWSVLNNTITARFGLRINNVRIACNFAGANAGQKI